MLLLLYRSKMKVLHLSIQVPKNSHMPKMFHESKRHSRNEISPCLYMSLWLLSICYWYSINVYAFKHTYVCKQTHKCAQGLMCSERNHYYVTYLGEGSEQPYNIRTSQMKHHCVVTVCPGNQRDSAGV